MAIDFRDVLLEVQADIRKIFQEVMIELTTPQMEMELKRTWAMLPPQLKDKIAAERPEEYAELMKHIGGNNHG